MILPKEVLLEHLATVNAAEQAAMSQINLSDYGIPEGSWLGQKITDIKTATHVRPPMINPRVSQMVLRAAFLDLSSQYNDHQPLYGFVGEHVIPLVGAQEDAITGPTCQIETRKTHCCGLAEPGFFYSLAQVREGTWHGQERISVYHDGSGRPVLFRKTREASTALTLSPMRARGIPIPPGTIVSVPTSMGRDKTGERSIQDDGHTFTLTTFRLPENIAIGLGRISAVAYEQPIDRLLFAVDAAYNNGQGMLHEELALKLEAMTIVSFRQAAHRVMELCGVQPSSISG